MQICNLQLSSADLSLDGGPSQVDTFNPKPLLDKYHRKPLPAGISA